MICQAQFNFRQTTHIAQLRQARSARSTSRTHAACRGGYPGVHAPHSELFFDVISALTAACVLALWAEVAEPQKEPDVRQPEAIMVHTPQLISRSLSEYGVLIEDDMDDGGGELVVPQSPNPGVFCLTAGRSALCCCCEVDYISCNTLPCQC